MVRPSPAETVQLLFDLADAQDWDAFSQLFADQVTTDFGTQEAVTVTAEALIESLFAGSDALTLVSVDDEQTDLVVFSVYSETAGDSFEAHVAFGFGVDGLITDYHDPWPAP